MTNISKDESQGINNTKNDNMGEALNLSLFVSDGLKNLRKEVYLINEERQNRSSQEEKQATRLLT